MIKITKYMAFDGREFFTEKEVNEYEDSMLSYYEENLNFKSELPCESFTVGKIYPFFYKRIGMLNQGVIFTINDSNNEIILGETWLNGVIKNRFSLVFK